jgi:putative restriction endonuclease
MKQVRLRRGYKKLAKSLDDYRYTFTCLNVNRSRDGFSPHKPCMLLAVLDLAQAGALSTNEIHYLPPLLERYRDYFDVVRRERDHPNPSMPFFHMRSDGFWHLQPHENQRAALDGMRGSNGHAHIRRVVAHVALDTDLHALIQQPTACAALSDVLISHWFPQISDRVRAVRSKHAQESDYERALRTTGKTVNEQREEPPRPVRDAAFRRLVLEAYDYRCAASGLRIIVPGGPCLVEAAHIKPFAISFDDRPANGIALSPTYHRAFDLNLISPDSNLCWRVSPVFDERIADHRELLSLEGKPVILGREVRYRPDAEMLEWRMGKLLR